MSVVKMFAAHLLNSPKERAEKVLAWFTTESREKVVAEMWRQYHAKGAK